MSPAAGGAAPTQPAASAGLAPAAIAAPPPPQAPSRENPRDPAAQAEGADPGNAAARKTAWNVPPPPPASVGGIMGGDESWPALADTAARAWPKSSSSDSLKSLSDGSAPSAPEDSIVPLVPPPQPQPVSTPISTAISPGPASTSPPPSAATTTASSPQNGSTSQPILVRHGGGNGGNNGGGGGGNVSTHSQSTGNYSSDGNSSSGGDGNWNDGDLSGGSNLNSSVLSGAIGGSGIDNSRRAFGSNSWSGNGRGGGSYNNATGSGDGGNRYNGGSGSGHWNNNARHGSGSSNGFGGRGGRNRRDHERGSNFSPRNYSRALPVQQQQQQGYYQPGPFQRPPPPSPAAAHFMVPQPFMPYVQPIPYPTDLQASHPYHITQVEQQFQNMHLIRPPMQPLAFQQDQINLQHDIQLQIEHYFSTNNLCHDTYLRGRMDDQGWVPIDLIASFPMLTRFTMLGIDTNYILDSIRGSELLEVQGNFVRRRNDWAAWLLHRGPPPSN